MATNQTHPRCMYGRISHLDHDIVRSYRWRSEQLVQLRFQILFSLLSEHQQVRLVLSAVPAFLSRACLGKMIVFVVKQRLEAAPRSYFALLLSIITIAIAASTVLLLRGVQPGLSHGLERPTEQPRGDAPVRFK